MAHITNKLRGLVAAFVAVFAALALVPGVANAKPVDFPADLKGSITIKGDVSTSNTINVYRVADLKVDDVTNETSLVYAVGMEDSVSAWKTNESADTADDVAAAVVNNGLSPLKSGTDYSIDNLTDGNNGVKISGLKPGVYYVDIEDVNGQTAFQTIIMSVEAVRKSDNTNAWEATNKEVEVKSSSSQLEKTAIKVEDVEVTGDGHSVSAVMGDVITFKVEFTLSSNMSTFYVDDLMTGMTFGDNVTLYDASDQPVSAADVLQTETSGITNATFRTTIDVTKLGSYFSDESPTAEFYITYTGTVVDNGSNTGAAGATNKVFNASDTEGDTVNVKLASLKVTKVDKNDAQKTLAGAEFKLYTALNDEGAVDENSLVTTVGESGVLTTDANGVIQLDKLLDPDQTYYLVETKAPNGYVVSNPEAGYEMIQFTQSNNYTVAKSWPNEKSDRDEGIDLPTTGGAGTVALTAAGVVLVAGAAAFIVRSRKEN